MTPRSVLVVGGGVVGLCVAYYSLRKGFEVTVLDRDPPASDSCSYGNAGMVVPSHFIPLAAPGMVGLGLRMLLNPASPFAIQPRADRELLEWLWRFYRSANEEHVRRSAPALRDLSLASRRCFEELAEELDDFGLVKRGLLMFCKTPETLHEEGHVAKMAAGLGIEAEVLSPGEARHLDPALELDVAGAVYFPGDCHLDPHRMMTNLTQALMQGGARIIHNAEVTGWKTVGGRIEAAVTSAGAFVADEFVAAGGSWSAEMLKNLRIRLPLQAGKGYSITLPQPAVLPDLCSILVEARVAVTPMGGALRFAGTMELGGLDRSVNRRRVEGLARSIPSYFPQFAGTDFSAEPVWSGLRPCSPDGLPYIGRCAGWSNLALATGHAMMGVSLAPATGKLLAEVLAGERPEVELPPFSPNRFG